MSMEDTRIPATKCPTCDATLSGAARPNPGDTTRPVPGDFSICSECRTPARFGDDMQLRLLTEQDILDSPMHDFSVMNIMLQDMGKKGVLELICDSYEDE